MKLPRFSLRLLLLAVALCAWLAWERSVVTERRALRAKLEAGNKEFIEWLPQQVRPRWSRRLFGDESIQYITIWDNNDDRTWKPEAKRVFPEAKILGFRATSPASPPKPVSRAGQAPLQSPPPAR